MNLEQKIKYIEQLKSLMRSLDVNPSEQVRQVGQICLNKIYHELERPRDQISLQLTQRKMVAAPRFDHQLLQNWLEKSALADAQLQQRAIEKRKSFQALHFQAVTETTLLHAQPVLTTVQHAEQPHIQATPESFTPPQHNFITTEAVKTSQIDMAPAKQEHLPMNSTVQQQLETTNTLGSALKQTLTPIRLRRQQKLEAEAERVKRDTYTMVACTDISPAQIIEMNEVTPHHDTPVLLVRERRQLCVIHGERRLALAEQQGHTHVPAFILDRQQGFSWQKLHQILATQTDEIEAYTLYHALLD